MISFNSQLNKDEKFWLNDPRELYKNGNWLKLPTLGMSRIEQYNSIVRLSVYIVILILIFDQNTDWICFPVLAVTATVVMYNLNQPVPHQTPNLDKKKVMYNKKNNKKALDPTVKATNNSVNDLASLDSRGSLGSLSSLNSIGSLRSNNSSCIMDDLIGAYPPACRKPTYDNPYMNPTLTDYNVPDPPAACNADDEEINENIEVQFNQDLFRGVDELWERENSKRQFYTVPNTAVPNNQVEFAKWLYSGAPTCKEDTTQCLRQTELRRNNRQLNPF